MQPMFVVGTTSKDPKHAEARKRRRHAEKTRAETDPALAEKLKAQSVAGAGRARKSEARYSERFAKEREELLLQQQNERPSAMLAPDVDGLITEAEACHAGPDAAAFLQSVWNERALDDLGEKSRSIELSLYDDDDEPSGGEEVIFFFLTRHRGLNCACSTQAQCAPLRVQFARPVLFASPANAEDHILGAYREARRAVLLSDPDSLELEYAARAPLGLVQVRLTATLTRR